MTHDDFRAATGAYALGALPPDEREAVTRHLQECPECAAEVAALRAVAGELAYTAPPQRAPAALRQRVLDRVTWEAAQARAAAPGTHSDVRFAATGVPRGASWWLLAAAAVLVLGVGGYALDLRSRIARLEVRLADAIAEAAAAEQSSLLARNELATIRQSTTILTAADVARVELKPETLAPNAKARAYWSPSRGMIFTAAGLPPAPSGRVYQVWAVTGLAPLSAVSAGLLTTDASGEGLVINRSLQARPVAFAVTLEPAGGVPAPTGPRVLLGAL